MRTSSAASKIQDNLQELFKANLSPGDAYIRFQLTSEMIALLSMEQVQESLMVEAEKITPLPGMPESVIGIMSSRDRVFCVFDLTQLLNLPSELVSPRQYQIIVLQTTDEQSFYLGFVVNRLQGIMRLTAENILSSAALPSEIVPYLCGAVQDNETIIPVLDFNRILDTLTTVADYSV